MIGQGQGHGHGQGQGQGQDEGEKYLPPGLESSGGCFTNQGEKMQNITEETLKKAKEIIGKQLLEYLPEINQAYLEADNALKVALKLEFDPQGEGIAIESAISFQTGRKVKDSVAVFVGPEKAGSEAK